MRPEDQNLADQVRELLLEAEAQGKTSRKEFGQILLAASEELGILNASSRRYLLQQTDAQMGGYSFEYAMELLQQIASSPEASEYDGVSFNITGMTIINNRFGMDNGSKVMRAYLKYLQDLIGEDGFLARIGGDRFFAVYRREYREEVISFVKGIEVKLPDLADRGIHMSCSAGFIRIDEAPDAASLMDAMNTARRIAKFQQNTTWVFYNDEIRTKLATERRVELMFPAALRSEEFEIYYQPKVELHRYHLSGAEALCRWFHEGKMIMPGDFIPVLERSGAICELDFYVLDHVCRDLRRWLDEGRKTVCVSVNLSRCNLGNPELLDQIVGTIEKYSLPAGLVEIEVTETASEVSFHELQKLIIGLRKAGIPCSLDDFGAGYSSMSTLSEIPWSFIKIDRSLVPVGDGTPEDEKRKILIRSIVSMAGALGINCITEGVETLSQSVFLKSIDCYLAQGFFFDRPMPKEQFEGRLAG
jgi:EAL domain-containing protein (putative c-di-GMP-specific phosphodiesterase class I)/GGDEF domain-containing protein